jgi:hypothetical protein
MNTNMRVTIFNGALFILVVQVPLLAACNDQQPVLPAPVCATWQAPDGTWMEEDNEPVDAYPCDGDDMFPKVKPSTKKPAPAKSTQPIGGKKKRF